MEKGLNNKDTSKKRMDKQDKKVLNALNFIHTYTKKEIDDFKRRKVGDYDYNLPEDMKKFLLDKKYISEKGENLHDKSRYITETGNDYRLKLMSMKYNYGNYLVGIINAIFLILNILLFLYNLKLFSS